MEPVSNVLDSVIDPAVTFVYRKCEAEHLLQLSAFRHELLFLSRAAAVTLRRDSPINSGRV